MLAIYKIDKMGLQEETFYLHTVYMEKTTPACIKTWVLFPLVNLMWLSLPLDVLID